MTRISSQVVRRHFIKDEGGVASIEFFMVMPFLFLLVFASTEIARAVIFKQKVEQAGYAIASAISTYLPATSGGAAGEITWDDLNTNVLPIVNKIMHPYAQEQGEIGVLVSYFGYTANQVCDASTLPTCPSMQASWMAAFGSNVGTELLTPYLAGNPAITLNEIQSKTACSEAATDDATRYSCIQELQTQLVVAPPYESLANYLSTKDQGFVMVELFVLYQPIFETLMNDVNAAAGNLVATFTFSLPETVMKKRTLMMSRSGVLQCAPPVFPCP